MAATVIFMFANSVAWLFAARAVQGLALSAASAALLDLHPRRDAGAVGLHNGAANAGGMGLGVLISAVIVEVLPAPRVLPYYVIATLIAGGGFGVAFLGALRTLSSAIPAEHRGSVMSASTSWPTHRFPSQQSLRDS